MDILCTYIDIYINKRTRLLCALSILRGKYLKSNQYMNSNNITNKIRYRFELYATTLIILIFSQHPSNIIDENVNIYRYMNLFSFLFINDIFFMSKI